jgi:branched-chain amino acid transport system permease protein
MRRFTPGEILVAAGLLAYALFPFVAPTQAWLGFAINAMLISVLGIAWNISGGFAGQMSFGHAALFGTGAYATAMLQVKLGINPWAGAVIGIMAGAAMGGFIGALSFRYGLRGSYFALVTLAFAEVLRILVSSFDIAGGGQGLTLPYRPGVGNFQFVDRLSGYVLVLALVLAGLAISLVVKHSRFGAISSPCGRTRRPPKRSASTRFGSRCWP